jgi:outer membrane protein assembly factor BamD (BamD/ComL family)
VIGDVALAAQDPAGAEQAYAQVLALVPTSDAAQQGRYAERLAAAIYRQGEAERAAGRTADAARHFTRVGRQAPNSSAAPAALYDGALQLIALKDWAGATAALQALRTQHPQHPLAASAAPQLALAQAEERPPARGGAGTGPLVRHAGRPRGRARSALAGGRAVRPCR